MLATAWRTLKRLPQPLVPPLPMLVTVLGPGLLLWLIAFHIPVNYPQETMAPYPHGLTANMLPGYAQPPAQAVASAPESPPHLASTGGKSQTAGKPAPGDMPGQR